MRYSALVAGVMMGLLGGREIDQPADEFPAAHGPPVVSRVPRPPVASSDPRDPTFEEEIFRVVKEYRTYARVSDQANWSPMLCIAPPPTGVQKSTSGDDETHGRKLYFLWASYEQAYEKMSWGEYAFMPGRLDTPPKPEPEVVAGGDGWTNPVGMAVVKESFKPVEVPEGEEPAMVKSPLHREHLPDDYAEQGGKLYRAGDPMGLFIMLKLDPKREGTDNGWIYAVTTPDAEGVIAVGKIASCMECHVKTHRDRLYGHKLSWPKVLSGLDDPNVIADLKRFREASYTHMAGSPGFNKVKEYLDANFPAFGSDVDHSMVDRDHREKSWNVAGYFESVREFLIRKAKNDVNIDACRFLVDVPAPAGGEARQSP